MTVDPARVRDVALRNRIEQRAYRSFFQRLARAFIVTLTVGGAAKDVISAPNALIGLRRISTCTSQSRSGAEVPEVAYLFSLANPIAAGLLLRPPHLIVVWSRQPVPACAWYRYIRVGVL